MFNILSLFCRHKNTFPKITSHPSNETKTYEIFCNNKWCKKLIKREVYGKKDWGYELQKEQYF